MNATATRALLFAFILAGAAAPTFAKDAADKRPVELAAPTLDKKPVDWVEPRIDTVKPRWFYFNSACRPFGMVNLSPDTQTKGDWNAGYRYKDDTIQCFSHIHCWQLAGVAAMPVTGKTNLKSYASKFSHDDEVVRPGYHKVLLKSHGITAEITSSTRVGFHRYTYPDGESARVVLDLAKPLMECKMRIKSGGLAPGRPAGR